MKHILKQWGCLLIAVILLFTVAGCSQEEAPAQTFTRSPEKAGWRAIAPYHMSFIAVGTEGKISEIDVDTQTAKPLESPTTATLRDIVHYNGTLVAVGDKGTVLKSTDGKTFTQVATLKGDFDSITYWNDKYVAAGLGGVLAYSYDAKEWIPVTVKDGDKPFTDTVTGLAASGDTCIGVTEQGRAIVSHNTTDWTIFEYNTYYSKETAFNNIVWNGTMFSATGMDKKTGAAVVTTLSGEVWSERDLSYYNGEPQDVSGLTASGLAWDGQQWHLSCNGGTIYTIPDCAQCNKTAEVGGGTLTAIAYNGGKLAVGGEGYTVAVVDTDAVRQYSISADTAYQHQQAGTAMIIDVRSAEEFAEKHIAGAYSLPLDGLDAGLEGLCPDKSKELIFYCTKGMRSQTALEKAKALGYSNVYSLGAMDKWTYAFE